MGGVSKAQKLTPKKLEAFLKVMEQHANVSEAAKAIGCDRRALYKIRSMNPEFAQAWEDAVQVAVDRLEKIVWERAMHGTKEEVFGKEGQIGTKTKQSDLLAIFMLKGNRPEKYRERYELSGDPTKPIKVQEVSDEHLMSIVANSEPKKLTSGE